MSSTLITKYHASILYDANIHTKTRIKINGTLQTRCTPSYHKPTQMTEVHMFAGECRGGGTLNPTYHTGIIFQVINVK